MSEEIKWKPGDVVRVKSGGPLTTVGSISKAGRVICECSTMRPKTKSENVMADVYLSIAVAGVNTLNGAKVALGEMRSTGLTKLPVYCGDYKCAHSILMNADRWSDT